jgi:hypothetical protein
MKKNVLKMAFMGMMLMTTNEMSAQIDLQGLADKVLGGSSAQQGSNNSGDLIQNLTTVFSKNKQAKSSNIVGTWSYTEPAIVLNSGNFLSNAAYKIAANKIESKLQSYLTQYGIKPGTFTMTFNEDGTFSETLKGKTMKGKWAIQDEKLVLTIGKVKAVKITTQISGSEMQLVTDATKLLTMFQSFGANSSNSSIKTAAALLKGVKEMQAGITLKKQ